MVREAHEEGIQDDAPLPDATLEQLLIQGATLFDDGHHWHAHEAWETAWHGAPPNERDFFQGLIHAAAALVHHEKGNAEGFRLQTGKMRTRLATYSTHRRIDTHALMDAIEALPPPATATTYPAIPWRQR